MEINQKELSQKIIDHIKEKAGEEQVAIAICIAPQQNFLNIYCPAGNNAELGWAKSKALVAASMSVDTIDYARNLAIVQKIPFPDVLTDERTRLLIGGVLLKDKEDKIILAIGVHGLNMPSSPDELSSPPQWDDFPNHTLAESGRAFAAQLLGFTQ